MIIVREKIQESEGSEVCVLIIPYNLQKKDEWWQQELMYYCQY